MGFWTDTLGMAFEIKYFIAGDGHARMQVSPIAVLQSAASAMFTKSKFGHERGPSFCRVLLT
jgi:hypothetical protein